MRIDARPSTLREGYWIVVPHGPIDTESHDEFRHAVEPLIAKTTRGIVIDLEHVHYISSAGLGVLFSFKKHLDEKKAELLFCHAQPQIDKLFDTVKFLPKDRVFRSLEEADQFFYGVMNKEIEKRAKD